MDIKFFIISITRLGQSLIKEKNCVGGSLGMKLQTRNVNNLPIMQVEEFNQEPLAVFFVCTKISSQMVAWNLCNRDVSFLYPHSNKTASSSIYKSTQSKYYKSCRPSSFQLQDFTRSLPIPTTSPDYYSFRQNLVSYP